MPNEDFNTPPPNESRIVEHVCAEYDPEVILLGGSRAKGIAGPSSDWDLYLIGDFQNQDRYPESYRGQDLDVAVYPREAVADSVLKIFYGPLECLRVLKDNASRDGARIAEKTQLAYRQGPPPLTANEVARRRHELERLIAKALPILNDPVGSMLNFGLFYQELVPLWFALRHRWPQSFAKNRSVIQAEDPHFVSLLDGWALATSMDARLELSRQLIECIFARGAG